MATQALPRKRSVSNRGRRGKKSGIRWHAWWPLVLATVATPFAVKTAEILPLMGPEGIHRLCLLFPFALLAQQHQLGLGEHLAEQISQASMYLQFPFYGLLLVLMQRFKSFAAGMLTIVMLHIVAAAAAWLLVSIH
jgi:hypothetical protein